MALYAFDGTGNKGKATDPEGIAKDSNVVDFFRGYADPAKDDDVDDKTGSLYLNGIGTRAHLFVTEKIAEAFGVGGHKRIREAIRRLETTSRPRTQPSISSASVAGRRSRFPLRTRLPSDLRGFS
jgi:hypothetical protein